MLRRAWAGTPDLMLGPGPDADGESTMLWENVRCA